MRLRPAEFTCIAAAVAASLDGSLRRLQRDQVDILHLHNPVTTAGEGESLSVRQVLEIAIRFAIAHPAMGTILVGMASVDEFEAALAAVLKGPLPATTLRRVAELTAGFSGESR